MKKTIPNKFIQRTIVAVLFGIGFYGLLMVCDEDPLYQKTEQQWFMEKIIGFAIIVACVLVGKYLYRKGYLSVMETKTRIESWSERDTE